MLTALLSLLTVKGAPDVLLQRCNTIVGADGAVGPLTEQASVSIQQIKDKWSSEGRRVILLARKTVNRATPLSTTETEGRILREASNNLTLVGLLALVDPPRTDIPNVMKTLHGAGIRTFMVRFIFF